MSRSAGSPDLVLVDGVPATHVSVLDRGLHYGDGLFETISCPEGRPRLLQLHLERLAHGCERLAIPLGDLQTIRDEITRAAAGTTCVLKLIVTRGDAVARGYTPTGSEHTRRILMRFGWPAEREEWSRDGVAVAIARHQLGENPALAGLKHLNRLEQVLARAELRDPEISEALLFSSSGRLVSGTMSNVFIVSQRVLRTPRVDRCGVAGVMRRAVLEEAASAGVECRECELGAPDLESADEIFLTNARVGIWPVRRLAERNLVPGPIARLLQARLTARFASEAVAAREHASTASAGGANRDQA